MKKAAFAISNYIFDKIQIDLSNQKSNELSLSFETKGIFHNDNLSYELIFLVSVFEKGNKEPFISVRCKGFFEFEEVSNLEDIPDYFYRNSIAILFPYVRSYISLVTTQANIPGIILPTLNLSSLEEELRKNTSKV